MIYSDINTNIDNIQRGLILFNVPEDKLTDFDAGVYAANEYLSLTNLEYYNSLTKIKLHNYSLIAAMKMIPETKETSVSQNSESQYAGQLTSEEFIDQGESGLVFVESTSNFIPYQISGNETLRDIAIKFFGTHDHWTEIAEVNNITENDLLDNAMEGAIIKIPASNNNIAAQLESNMVFETSYDINDSGSIETYFLGSDIYLNDGKMSVDSSGDLKKSFGVDCFMQNLKARLGSRKGSLNALHPDWGVGIFGDKGDMPFMIMLEKTLCEYEEQIQADPRVTSGFLKRNTVKLTGDALYIDAEIELLGGFTTVKPIEVGV